MPAWLVYALAACLFMAGVWLSEPPKPRRSLARRAGGLLRRRASTATKSASAPTPTPTLGRSGGMIATIPLHEADCSLSQEPGLVSAEWVTRRWQRDPSRYIERGWSIVGMEALGASGRTPHGSAV